VQSAAISIATCRFWASISNVKSCNKRDSVSRMVCSHARRQKIDFVERVARHYVLVANGIQCSTGFFEVQHSKDAN